MRPAVESPPSADEMDARLEELLVFLAEFGDELLAETSCWPMKDDELRLLLLRAPYCTDATTTHPAVIPATRTKLALLANAE